MKIVIQNEDQFIYVYKFSCAVSIDVTVEYDNAQETVIIFISYILLFRALFYYHGLISIPAWITIPPVKYVGWN